MDNNKLKPQEYYIGLLSGTSIDSIDAALFTIDSDKIQLIHTHGHEIPNKLKQELNNIIQKPIIELEYLGKLNRQLGVIFSEAVLALLNSAKKNASSITAIGFHGQTVFHHPIQPYNFTMQLGCPSTIVEKTKIPVITDFRQRDMVNGGQGAPLAPLFHQRFFKAEQKNRAIINIGGITNITLLVNNSDLLYIASDLGPGNTLLDLWFRQHNLSSAYYYDFNGDFAKSGELNTDLLQLLLSDPYFTKSWPKSTGREYFNADWLNNYLKKITIHEQIPPNDVQCTITELTALVITNCLDQQQVNYDEVYLCGGGARNKYLVDRIKSLSKNRDVQFTDVIGINIDWVEAATFAWLAYCSWHKQAHNLKHITGNKTEQSSLGCIYY